MIGWRCDSGTGVNARCAPLMIGWRCDSGTFTKGRDSGSRDRAMNAALCAAWICAAGLGGPFRQR
jgi:hypothetical protein